MLSVGLVGTWVYHLYDKTQYSKRRTEVFIKDSIAVAEAVRDSLQKIYTVTITDLDTRLDSSRTKADSLKFQLNTKLSELFKLKGEIENILKNRNSTKADLQIAKEKIGELQGLVEEMKGQKDIMEEEKKQLSAVMTQLTGEISGLQQTMTKLDAENKVLKEKVNLASVFVASEVKLTPVTTKNNKEQETNAVNKAEKIIVSFNVQNNVNAYDNAEVYIVLTQPDGSVFKPDVWESSSSMETYKGEKRSYTRKIKFEYEKGEPKPLLFSLSPDGFQKGKYSLQLYHNGYLIGQTSKTLN